MRGFVLHRMFALAVAPALVAANVVSVPTRALANGPAAPASDSPDTSRPRVLYRQAESAFSAGKYEDARKLLLEAWGIRRTYDVAAALGQAELELKLYRDAAEHLDFAVQNFAPMESENALEGLKSDLRSAKSQVVEARIAVSEPRATISVNGQALGQSPLSASVFLEPGSYVFEAALGPDRKTNKRMALERGGTYDVQLSIPRSALTATGPIDKPDEERQKPNLVPPVTAAIVGGVALVTGVGLLIAANSKDNTREEILNGLPGTNSCGARADLPSECSRVADLADGAATFRTVAVVSLGAAVGAGVVSYLLWPKASSSREAAFVAAPSYSPDGHTFGFAATGRF